MSPSWTYLFYFLWRQKRGLTLGRQKVKSNTVDKVDVSLERDILQQLMLTSLASPGKSLLLCRWQWDCLCWRSRGEVVSLPQSCDWPKLLLLGPSTHTGSRSHDFSYPEVLVKELWWNAGEVSIIGSRDALSGHFATLPCLGKVAFVFFNLLIHS